MPKSGGPARWKRALLLAGAFVVAALIALGTVAKVYATLILPAPPENWNASQLEKIERSYRDMKKSFYDTGDPQNIQGFSIAVFGDIHNSVYTFDKLVRRINETNVKVDAELKKLETELAGVLDGTGVPPEQRDRSALALEKKINEKRKSRILFAVANGDLTISGNEVQYRMFFEQAKKLEVPFVTTPGNHDARASSSDVYRKIFGPRYYSFALGEQFFIMLDDSDQKRIEPAQMKWFEGELKKSEPYRYCMVFMHVPAFKGHRDTKHSDVTIPWSEYLGDRKNALEFKKLCEKYEVSFVLGSHLHTFDLDIWDMSDELDEDGAMKRNKDDGMVWTIISGGAGAQLWKTYDWRACYHYFVGRINGEFSLADSPDDTYIGTQFDRIVVKSKDGEHRYFVEKLWTYALTDVVNNYLWGMLVLVPALVLLLRPLLSGWRKRRSQK